MNDMNSSFTASDKRVDLDPLAAHVRDGDCAAFGGGLSSRVPMAAVRALLRRGTGFELIVADELSVAPLPGSEALSIIRRLDPIGIHFRELRPHDQERCFAARQPDVAEAS